MTNDHPGLHLENQLDAIANTWRPEVDALRLRNDELRAENERLKEAVTGIGVAHIAAHTENERLRAALTEIMAMAEPAGYGESSKAQIRDAARRALSA
jgi:hypothetical protein